MNTEELVKELIKHPELIKILEEIFNRNKNDRPNIPHEKLIPKRVYEVTNQKQWPECPAIVKFHSFDKNGNACDMNTSGNGGLPWRYWREIEQPNELKYGLKFWVARDTNRTLTIYIKCPFKGKLSYFPLSPGEYMFIDSRLFPDLKFGDGPMEINI